MKEKRNKIITIVSIVIAILVLVLGVTYAFMTFNREGSKFSTLVTGDIYMHYNESNNINLDNVVPRSDYSPDAYFEFTIKGKNTNTVHDIIYDIQITDGDNHETRTVRIDPKFLKFRLVEVNGGNEKVIVDNKRYDNLYQDRIWVDRIVKNTIIETTKTYRLYVWISDTIRLGNTESADYDLDTWNNDIYASIKVNVTGDFNDKQIVADYLRVASSTSGNTQNFLNSDLIKNTIEKIVFTNTKEVPIDVLGIFDASEKQNGSIMGWYCDSDDNDLYEVYIGGEGGVYANANSSYLFYYLTSLKEIDFTYFRVTDVVTKVSHMFSSASSLISLNDIGNWDTSNVTNMAQMFYGASSLASLDLSKWNTSSVTNMSSMFLVASSLTNIGNLSNWNTSKVMDMQAMFSATALTNLDLSDWNTSSVTNMSQMFFSANSLTSIGNLSNWNTSKVTDMQAMFRATALTNLDLSDWNTSSVTNMISMFEGTSNLQNLNITNWNTSKVTKITYMFYGAKKLSKLDLSKWDTSNIISMDRAFYGTTNLTNLDLSSAVFDSVTNSTNMFTNTNTSLKIIVKDQGGHDFIYNLLPNANQKTLLTIKS